MSLNAFAMPRISYAQSLQISHFIIFIFENFHEPIVFKL